MCFTRIMIFSSSLTNEKFLACPITRMDKSTAFYYPQIHISLNSQSMNDTVSVVFLGEGVGDEEGGSLHFRCATKWCHPLPSISV